MVRGALAGLVLLLASCGSLQSADTSPATPSPTAAASPSSPSETPAQVLMPDLIGLPSTQAGRLLGELQGTAELGLRSNWGRPVPVHCGVRPRTVVRQQPAPGTPLQPGAQVQIRTAALDLMEFRGPCEPTGGDLGPATGPDTVLARQFYRFAADPRLGAPFADGEVWIGIENGPTSASLPAVELTRLAAWELGGSYAERTGPFSALDIVASSGGVYELHDGVAANCGFGNGEAPANLPGLRAISLTAPADVTDACMDWWAVTLLLDDRNDIRGVALRLGSP